MILRPEIRFRPGFPDDTIEGEEDTIEWPGRNITEALKAALEQRGYRVSEPLNAEHVGWELEVFRGRKRLWLQVSRLDDETCYILAFNKTSWLWPDVKVFQAFLSDLQSIMAADGRFGEPGWFPKGGLDLGMAPALGPFDT